MSEETKKIISAVKQGHLPPLYQSSDSLSNSSTNGIENSQRGLDRTTFGLQSLNEGLEINTKNEKD